VDGFPPVGLGLVDCSLHIGDLSVVEVDVVSVGSEQVNIFSLDLSYILKGAQAVLILLGSYPLPFINLQDPCLSVVDSLNDSFFQFSERGDFNGEGGDVNVKLLYLLV